MSKKYNIAEEFCIKRIQEFPTLFKHEMDVLSKCIIGHSGSTYWDENGMIQQEDQHYDPVTKTWGPYPFVITRELAESMLWDYHNSIIDIPWSIDGPITCIPDNAHPDWLWAIGFFLSRFEKYTTEYIQKIAEIYCFLQYGVSHNEAAGQPHRMIGDYTRFINKIPSWKARIKQIEYQQANKKIDPDSYLGMFI